MGDVMDYGQAWPERAPAPAEVARRLRELACTDGAAGPLLDLAEVWSTTTTANVLGDLAAGVALTLADVAAQLEAWEPRPAGEAS